MPPMLLERMLDVTRPKPAASLRQRLTGAWARRAILPIGVVVLIAALIWPRDTPQSSPTTQTGAAPADLRALVTRADQTLYQAPGDGLWHSSYMLRWTFIDGSYAPLIGEIWSDSEKNRSRIQLVHEAGGGPYEFSLGNGDTDLWYAITRPYGETIFPLSLDPSRLRVRLALDREGQQEAQAGRLNDGAWSLPRAYLQQAATAELNSWGAQRDTDGSRLEVIGFQGVSALRGSTNAPGGPNDTVTVLITVKPTTGELFEIRELIGPPGGDQVSRTIWRRLARNEITEARDADRIFNLNMAWRGSGAFPGRADDTGIPMLPLVSTHDLIAPSAALEFPNTFPIDFPAELPADTTRGFLASLGDANDFVYALTYLGDTRSLTIQGAPDSVGGRASFSTDGAIEQVTLAGRSALFRRMSADTYGALIEPAASDGRKALLQVYARGYTRDELISTLNSLAPISPATLRDQMRLFAPPGQNVEAVDTLLTALMAEPQPEPGKAVRTTARVYSRQQKLEDPLPDPYHLVSARGQAEELTQETWVITYGRAGQGMTFTLSSGNGAILVNGDVTQTLSVLRGADDQIFARLYKGTFETWVEDLSTRTLNNVGPDTPQPIQLVQQVILRMLTCEGKIVETPQGRAVAVRDTTWTSQACGRPNYPALVRAQQQSRWLGLQPDSGPYLSDIDETTITTFAFFDAQGRVSRIETRAGTTLDGLLVESWERSSEETLAATQLPAAIGAPPTPLFVVDTTARSQIPPAVIFRSTTISDALKLVKGPLLVPDISVPVNWYTATTLAAEASQPISPPDWPFDDALWRGRAIQLEALTFSQGANSRTPLRIYLGPAEPFAELLRARAIWRDSTPISVEVAGKDVLGWNVETLRGHWVLAESDGVLLAFPYNPVAFELVANLTPIIRNDPTSR
jgi:hypothetical protein